MGKVAESNEEVKGLVERMPFNVVMLPTAAGAPVVNPRRRGRPPQGVVPAVELASRRWRKSQQGAEPEAPSEMDPFDAETTMICAMLSTALSKAQALRKKAGLAPVVL